MIKGRWSTNWNGVGGTMGSCDITWLTCSATKQFPRKNFTRTSLSLQMASAAVKDRKQLTLKFSPLPLPSRIPTSHSYLGALGPRLTAQLLKRVNPKFTPWIPPLSPPTYWNSLFSSFTVWTAYLAGLQHSGVPVSMVTGTASAQRESGGRPTDYIHVLYSSRHHFIYTFKTLMCIVKSA